MSEENKVAVVAESSNESAVETQSEQSTQESNDSGESTGWDDAKEAFEETEHTEEPEGEDDSHLEVTEEPKEEKGEDKSVDPYESLPVPHKYKGKIKEFVEKQTSALSKRTQELEQSFNTTQEANGAVVNVLKAVAADPSKLVEIVAEYGDQFGLERSLVEQYRSMKYRGGDKQTQQNNEGVQSKSSYDEVFNKYVEKLISTEDPKDFANTLKSVIFETQDLSKNEMIGVVKELLGGYHDKIVRPNIDDLEKQREVATVNARKSTWKNALSAVSEKVKENGDFDKYLPAIKNKLDKDPRKYILNDHPEAAAKNGITHESLLEEAYYLVSRNDHMNQKKKDWNGGLRPTPKFVGTKKQVAGDWDDIKRELYPDD